MRLERSTWVRYRLISALLVVVAVLLAGCGTAGEAVAPTATTTAPTTTATAVASASTATVDPPHPTATASALPAAPGNPFKVILGPVGAPPGWTVEPCEGAGPFLCVSIGGEFAGAVELLQYPIAQHQDAEQWMLDAGLEPEQPLDPADPEQAHAARMVLRALRGDHMGVIQEDREITYPESRSFVLLEPEDVAIGRLPGLFYGFAGLEEGGETYERWLTYAALDGQDFYFLTAFYDPSDTPGSFPGDGELLTFAPYLRDIVAGLRLPNQAMATAPAPSATPAATSTATPTPTKTATAAPAPTPAHPPSAQDRSRERPLAVAARHAGDVWHPVGESDLLHRHLAQLQRRQPQPLCQLRAGHRTLHPVL